MFDDAKDELLLAGKIANKFIWSSRGTNQAGGGRGDDNDDDGWDEINYSSRIYSPVLDGAAFLYFAFNVVRASCGSEMFCLNDLYA